MYKKWTKVVHSSQHLIVKEVVYSIWHSNTRIDPSFVGILGNDFADKAARKSAGMLPHPDVTTQLSDIKTFINNKLKAY